MKYTLYVSENARYMDEKARYQVGEFETLQEVVCRARQIVDDFLSANYEKGMTVEELYALCTSFGEDAFIAGGPPSSDFSSWDYAREAAQALKK